MAEDSQTHSEDTKPDPSSRERWNTRYRASEQRPGTPSPLLAEVVAELPTQGRAIDLAGGSGVDACVLAAHGLETTLLEVSDVALRMADERASAQGLALTLAELDLEAADTDHVAAVEGFDVVHCSHYLHRPTLRAAVDQRPMVLVVSIATTENLSRHERPSARFLLQPGELLTLAESLEILRFDEDWRSNGQHEAWLVASGEMSVSQPRAVP